MNPDEKPITMPLRDWLIKRIALQKNIPSAVIESIISHQFDSANAATYIHKSLEISGFGRFTFSDSKARAQMQRYDDMKRNILKKMEAPDIGDKNYPLLLEKLEGVIKNEKELKKRMGI
jgi:nucleoid DNA-binding protein